MNYMEQDVFDKEYLEEQAPVLALISNRLVTDPGWSLELLDVMSGRLLLPMYRQRRDNEHDLLRVIPLAEAVVDRYEGEIEDRVLLAHLLAKAERLEEALFRINGLIALKPKDAEFYRFKASILERMGCFKSAMAAARSALDLAPSNPDLKTDLNRIKVFYTFNRFGMLGLGKFYLRLIGNG